MIKSTNQVYLYWKIDQEMLHEAGLDIRPQFLYTLNEGMKEIQIDSEFNDILAVNEFDTEWSPVENDLIVRLFFTIHNPSVFYGEKGVTMDANKIGMAAHLHSRASGFQKEIKIGYINKSDEKAEIHFEHRFPQNSLRGTVEIDFFLYLESLVDSRPYHANKAGMRLTAQDLYNLTIVVDGEGSLFPISEFGDKNGPLWFLEKNWAEAGVDTFDSSSVSLFLNIEHPLFEQVKSGKTRASRALMNEIMIQAMSLIIQQVLTIEKNNLDDAEESSPNSILAVVNYWVSTFEVDTSSLFSITNSLRRNLERKLMGGE